MAERTKLPGELHDQARSAGPSPESTVHFTAEEAVAGTDSPLSGRYAINRLHAEGGLGRVSLGTDHQLKRPVAVKEIRPDRRTAEARRRFVNEAEITGQLEHPGIVPIYALEQDAAGEPYYVMRFIQGRPLGEAVSEYHDRPTRLAFHELLQRFTSVCQTIAYAHSRGILHRDLKPANIMLGEFGETLVVDWGLAKRMDAATDPAPGQDESSPSSPPRTPEVKGDPPGETVTPETSPSTDEAGRPAPSRTATGLVLGTPAYMAPEQAAGRWDQVGPASDIYSLGAMLYVILTGKLPIDANNTFEVIERVQRGDFPPPRQKHAAVPRALEAVCLKAMALQPAQRYATARELADEIDHWLADEPVLAYAEPWPERLGRWVRKHRLLVGSLAALLVTALVATTIGLFALDGERRRTADALRRVTDEEQKAQAALANTLRARQRTHQALTTLTNTSLQRVLARKTHLSEEDRTYLRNVQDLYQDFAGDTGNSETSREYAADGHFRVARIRDALGEHREAEAGYRKAIDLYAHLTADYPTNLRYRTDFAHCRGNFGMMLNSLGRFAEAEGEFTKSLTLREEIVAAEPNVSQHRHHLAGAHLNQGMCLGYQGHSERAVAQYRRALELLEDIVAKEPDALASRQYLAKALVNIAQRIRFQGQVGEALQHYHRAIAVRKALVAQKPADADYRAELANAQVNLANLLRERGRRQEAEPIYREAMAVLEKLSADYPVVVDYQTELAALYSNFGGVVRENGQPEASLAWFTKCIALLTPIHAREPNLVVVRRFLRVAYWGRALALDQLDRRADALRDWDQSVALCTDKEKPQIQMPRAASLAGAGRHQEAVAEANRLIQAPGASAELHYDAACVHALASQAVKDNQPLQEEYVRRAVELLREAKARGFFRNPAMVAYIRTDNDLKPLRDREDFKQLVAELEKQEPAKKN